MSQSNTKVGDILLPSNADLEGKEGYLAKIVSDSGVAEAALPAAITDYTPFVIIDGGTEAGERVQLRPLEPGRNVRVVLKDTCAPGDVLVLAAIAGSDAGKVRKLPTAGGTYRGIGIAEETGVDTQLVRMRPMQIGNIVVT